MRGDAGGYGATDYLLAHVINLLQLISWQLGSDDSVPKPDQFTIAGMSVPDGVRLGDSMSIEEMDARLRKYVTDPD